MNETRETSYHQSDERQPDNRQPNTTARTAAQVATYAIAIYAIGVFVLWILQLLVSERTPFIGLIQSTIHILLLPSLLLLPISLLWRKWRLALVVAPAVIAFIISYGVFFLPRSHEPALAESTMVDSTVRIMTFNLQAPDEEGVQSLVALVRGADADVVALQEMSYAAAEGFAAELDDLYPHQALHPHDNGHVGQGLLSRYPVVTDEFQRHEDEEEMTVLGHQRTTLSVDGTDVVFYNIHPIPPITFQAGFNVAQHTQALSDVIVKAKQESEPVIMLGDFNMTDQFHEYRRIQEAFTDAYKAVGDIGFGFTYPHDKWTGVPPFLRLDYIFYSPAFLGVRADVGADSGSSDHAPLVATLRLAQ